MTVQKRGKPIALNRSTQINTCPLLVGLMLLAQGCSAASGDTEGYYDTSPTPEYAAGDQQPTPTVYEPLPDEQGDSFYRAAPASTEKYVFVVNPDRHTMTKIEALSQAVSTVPVGTHPTQVLTGRLNDTMAVVLNEGDASVSLVDVSNDTVNSLPIHKDTNYLHLSPDGAYGITTFSDLVEGADLNVNGVRTYSAMTVIGTGADGETPFSINLTVGLNPRAVTFLAGGKRAIALCDDAIALIELNSSPTVELIGLSSSVDEELNVAELIASPDGHFVYIRLLGQAELMVVDLEDDSETSRISLDNVPSDMALSGETLILVDRDDSALLLFDALDPFYGYEEIETPSNQLVGKVAVIDSWSQAILYTTLSEDDLKDTAYEGMPLNRLSIWDRNTNEIVVREIVKPLSSVLLNGSEQYPAALLFHDPEADSELDAFDNVEAFSQFYLDDYLTVPAVLEAPIKATAHGPSSNFGFMILEDTEEVITINYQTRQLDNYTLQSPPVFVGIMAGTTTGYVSQEHELGRLTFVEPDDSSTTTITGFELNAQL